MLLKWLRRWSILAREYASTQSTAANVRPRHNGTTALWRPNARGALTLQARCNMLLNKQFKYYLGVFLAATLALGATAAFALKAGDGVSNLKLRDAEDEPANIPDLGRKVLAVFYTDPDVKDQNEALRDALKAANLDKESYRGLGVVNMKDTWKPDFAIRKVVRDKIAKFKAVILTDPGYILRDAWRLGDCDDKDVVIIIGKDSKVKFIKMGKVGSGEFASITALIQEEMKK